MLTFQKVLFIPIGGDLIRATKGHCKFCQSGKKSGAVHFKTQGNIRIAVAGPVVAVMIKTSEAQIFFALSNSNVTGFQLISVMVGNRTGNAG
jgi:hypothetical protein